jgi:hypothetical protein
VQTLTNQVKIQKDGTTNVLLPISSSQSTIQTTQSTESFRPLDLWQKAYDQLDEEERRVLSAIQVTVNLVNKENKAETRVLIDEVIHLTKEDYEEYQQKANGTFRTSSRKIINAALSFKDIIKAVAAFDPTQHAASAWAIVSLGLTVCNINQQSIKLAN